MRAPGLVTIAVGLCGLAAVMASTTPAPSGPVRSPVSASLRSNLADVAVRPGVQQAGRVQASPPTTADCEKAYKVACYHPAQIQQAYDLPSLYASGVTGRGTTIVIVDSFGSPTIRNDLKVFDKAFGLPAPPAFGIIQPAGRVPSYDPSNSDMVGWAAETTLDVEYAHVIAPGARILLVETPVSETEGVHGFPQIVKAEEFVIRHHLGDVISQSFSATEQTFPSRAAVQALRGVYQLAARNHVTVLAAAGDSGAADVKRDESTYYPFPVTSWPDSDPLVTGVGGTQLRDTAKHGWRSVVWNDTYNVPTQQYIFGNKGPNPLAGGGGKSVIFARPWYQN
ncbi:MAG: S53 family peptidase, partial [Streptosporangiaceae bacterium]